MQKILKIMIPVSLCIFASCGKKEPSTQELSKEVSFIEDAIPKMAVCSKDFLEEYNKLNRFCGVRDLSERMSIEACIIQYETMDRNYPDLKCQAELKYTATPLIITKFALNDLRGDYTREKYLASTNKVSCGYYVAKDLKNVFNLCSRPRKKDCDLTLKRTMNQYPGLNCVLTQDNKETTHVTFRDLEKLLKQ